MFKRLPFVLPAFFASTVVFAEIPLPDFVLYGTIERGGSLVGSGSVSVELSREGRSPLVVAGEFVDAEGGPYYLLRVPMETNIGAPGPSGQAALEGSTVTEIRLDGDPIELSTTVSALLAGRVRRVDGTAPNVVAPRFIRGDCNSDLEANLTDAVVLLNALFLGTGTPPCREACDADDDSNLQLTDAVFLLNHLFLGASPPPAPHPDCGIDPTSSLSCDRTACP